ncbi:MAG TPA: D-alanyl-D-alanine carboxypeptidase, partial [Fimbriimonadaceae bacterium]|nr:D-alanyl-D-alanine carboxypeptidase [Fimbriimonadaceae bacterium]
GLTGRKPIWVREAYRPLIPPSWEWDDLPNKYAAPVSAFTVDRGSIELWAEGEKLSILPCNYGLVARRGSKTGPRKVTYDPIRHTLTVDGELPKAKTKIDTLALDFPDVSAASFLGRRFNLTDHVPKSPPSLILGGPPLSATIKECLVHSDNNIAENLLLLAAAAEKPLSNDPYKDAEASLSRFLVSTVGVETGDFHPEDGSGMSRHDVVTTRGIVKLLQWALKQPTKDVWLDALAKPGAGTLQDRLSGVPFIGKTGTLDMVVALSGYVHTSKNRTLTVSLIFNQFICSERDARSIADDFVKKLVEDNGFGTVPANAGNHEACSAHPCSHSPDVRRNPRPGFDGLDACERTDRRAESSDASLHRPERMALRSR